MVIGKLESYPELWDTISKDYKNKIIKINALKEIANDDSDVSNDGCQFYFATRHFDTIIRKIGKLYFKLDSLYVEIRLNFLQQTCHNIF